MISAEPPNTTGPSVSVVVITRNRPSILGDCLRHVLAQEGGPFEAIVVDASDGDETEHLVARHSLVRHVRLRDAANQMPRSRNAGIRAAHGQVTAFLDDDSMAQPGWLRALTKHFADPRVGGVGGMVLAPGETPRDAGVVGGLSRLGTPSGSFNVLLPAPLRVAHLRGCNMSFRRDILLRLGGFDPGYDGSNYREDTDMCVRVRRAGYSLIYDPQAAVVHLYAPKEGYDRSNPAHRGYRFSVAKNTTYFRLRHFLNPLTLLSIAIVGPAWVLCQAPRHRPDLGLARADLGGRWAGLKAYLASRREGQLG